MPEPDFEQIARNVLYTNSRQDPETLREEVAEVLRQVWNVRGAADVKAISAYNSDDELARLLRKLDR